MAEDKRRYIVTHQIGDERRSRELALDERQVRHLERAKEHPHSRVVEVRPIEEGGGES